MTWMKERSSFMLRSSAVCVMAVAEGKGKPEAAGCAFRIKDESQSGKCGLIYMPCEAHTSTQKRVIREV